MERVFGRDLKERLDAMHQRQQETSRKLAELTSDPNWKPDCDPCVKERGAVLDGGGQGVEGRVGVRLDDGREAWALCPRYSDDCLLGQVQRQQRERREAVETRQWLRECGVGERYWRVTKERLPERALMESYLDNLGENVQEGRGVVLLGAVGVGKTAALALIAREAQGCRRAASLVRYTTVSRLMSQVLARLRAGGEYGGPSDDDAVGSACKLLLLDEFGAAYEHDYAMAAFEDYLGWRYDRKLATCVAGNLTPGQIRENPHYARMVDRWRETSEVIVMGGESQRKREE